MPNSTQLLYIVLVLPAIFSLVLIGDGINQIVHGEESGAIAVILGIVFIVLVAAAYFFFTNFH